MAADSSTGKDIKSKTARSLPKTAYLFSYFIDNGGDGNHRTYYTTTRDFKTFAPTTQ